MSLANNVREIVHPRYETISWEHGWPHVKSVAKSSKLLAEIVKADTELCQITAYCHDLGRVVEKKGPELGSSEHASDSVSETIKLLMYLRATDYQLSTVVSAVSVHSDKSYGGKNLVAKVLRDCDKKDALGPWGTLRCTKHWFKRDLVDVSGVIGDNRYYEQIESLAGETTQIIKNNQKLLPVYLNNLNFVLEWIDNKMLDNKEAYRFLLSDYAYSKRERLFLLSDTLKQLTEQSRDKNNVRKRAMHAFHNPEDKGKQFLVNMIQLDSYIQPHARFEEESIFHLQGKLCSIQLDEQGKLLRRQIIDESNPYIYIPANTFHTIVSLEENSTIGMTVFGPLKQPYRINAPFAPSEKDDYKKYFEWLKSLA